MHSSVADRDLSVLAASVEVTDETITVELVDGRSISVPTTWYPRLKYATPRERANYEIDDYGVTWPHIEADFSIRGLLLGNSGREARRRRYRRRRRRK